MIAQYLPGEIWCESDEFYIGPFPDLQVSVNPKPMTVGNQAVVSWSVTGGIPGLQNGGWTGDIRLQWYQSNNPLQNIGQVPVSQGSHTFTVSSGISGGTVPGCEFQIAGVNAETGTSIPPGYVYDYSQFFCIEGSGDGAIPAEERHALIDLYNSANGDNWTDNTNWLGDSGTECTWYGVTCDEGQNHVIQLNMRTEYIDLSIITLKPCQVCGYPVLYRENAL